MFAQLRYSCCLKVKQREHTAIFDSNRNANSHEEHKHTRTLGEPGSVPVPNHYSVLTGNTTQPAKVCGPSEWYRMTMTVGA